MKKTSCLFVLLAGLTGISNAQVLQIAQIGVMPGHPLTPTIHQSSLTAVSSFPTGISFDVLSGSTIVKKIVLPYAINADGASSANAWVTSIDGGATFSAPVTAPNVGGVMIRQRNGTMIALPFDNPNPFTYHTSIDNGATWLPASASINASLHVHGDIIEDIVGGVSTLYATGYTGLDIRLIKSTNGGAAWTYVSTPFDGGADGDGRSYGEPTLAVCADGSWFMVSRQDTGTDSTDELRYTRSTDKGLTWRAFDGVSKTLNITNIPIGTGFMVDVDPTLRLMPNGILVLSYGSRKTNPTPGWEYCVNKVAFSDDNGKNWHFATPTFTGVNTLGPPGGMTSGYSGVLPITAHRFMQTGDTGTTWTYSSVHPSTNPYSIWGKYVDIVRTEQNRIDLKTKYSLGAITIMSPETTLTYANAAHPEARTTGAFDGSNDYWSGALGTTSGVFQLDLQRTYNISTIGLNLLSGTQQSATVEYSMDKLTWSSAGVTYANATHYALNYTNVAPFNARYIRVNVSGTGQIGLTELELYETNTNTFENNAAAASSNPHGLLPPGPTGYTANGTSATQYGFSVQDGTGYLSNRALKLWDGSSGWRAGVKKITSASSTKTLEFRCRIAALPYVTGNMTAFNIPILGTVSGVENTVFWLAVFATGGTDCTVKANNGSGWVQIGSATLPISGSVWKLVKIVADVAGNATLSIDNTPMGTFSKFSASGTATNLTGFGLNSNGTPTSGEVVYFDDITFTN